MKDQYDICWEAKAGKKFKQIYKYLKKNYSERTAQKASKEIVDAIDGLRANPERYPPEPL